MLRCLGGSEDEGRDSPAAGGFPRDQPARSSRSSRSTPAWSSARWRDAARPRSTPGSPRSRNAAKSPAMICVEIDAAEGLDGVAGEERLAVGIVVLVLAGILLLWWQLHREARIADQVRDSEERFRSITQAALHPIVVTDDEGRITYWNDAAERTFGYRREEVLEPEVARRASSRRGPRRLSQSAVPLREPRRAGSRGREDDRADGGSPGRRASFPSS